MSNYRAMKQRFKARELWLFAPFLLVGAAALYWGRVERASGPNGRGMVISDVKVEAAPGYYQEKGMSHRVTVTVSHSWPRPKWWGAAYQQVSGIDVFHPEKPSPPSRGLTPNQFLEMGEALTIVRAGQTKPLPTRYGGNFVGEAHFDGTDYVSVNYFDLNSIPQQWGAVTLHGLYRIGGAHQVALKRPIREAGETLTVAPDKNMGGRLFKIDATPFYTTTYAFAPAKTTQTCSLWFNLDGLVASPNSDGKVARLKVYDVKVRDETGKLLTPNVASGLKQNWSGSINEAGKSPDATQANTVTSLEFSPTLVTKGRLTASGKVSINNRWPIPFEVKLPPRVVQSTGLTGPDRFSFPLWRDGKPAKP